MKLMNKKMKNKAQSKRPSYTSKQSKLIIFTNTSTKIPFAYDQQQCLLQLYFKVQNMKP